MMRKTTAERYVRGMQAKRPYPRWTNATVAKFIKARSVIALGRDIEVTDVECLSTEWCKPYNGHRHDPRHSFKTYNVTVFRPSGNREVWHVTIQRGGGGWFRYWKDAD